MTADKLTVLATECTGMDNLPPWAYVVVTLGVLALIAYLASRGL